MSFSPLPLPAQYQDSANKAAGFCLISGTRVAMSIVLAPASKARTSIPSNEADNKPTDDISEVRPPIQSNMGNSASQPSMRSSASILLPNMVTATA